MPFLGNQPSTGYSTIVKDDFTANGNDTVFTLSQAAASATSIAVFVGNVRQEPTDAYTVNGTTLTMSAAPANGANFYVLHISGAVENSSVPASGTVGTSQLANSAVTTAKIADDQITTAKIADDQVTSAKLANAINITSGNSLTIDSGATITNNGTASGFGGNNTPYFSVYLSANQSITSATWTKLQHNTVHVDSASGFDNTTNYRYTVPAGQGGKYFISVVARGITGSGNANWMRTGIYVNGVQIIENFSIYSLNSNLYGGGAAISAVYTLSAGDYIEHYAWLNGTSPFIYAGSWFSAFKLVE